MRKEETDCNGKHTDKFNAAEINTDIYFKAFACIILEFNLKVCSWPSGGMGKNIVEVQVQT